MKNKKFWENAFKNNLRSQRNFPNEELCRFLGRNNFERKKNINVLELGCGTGSNIPAFLFYNMKVTGIDFSSESIKICKRKFKFKKNVNFLNLNMLEIDKLKKNYDLIVDVFSSYNLNLKQNDTLLNKIYKKLKTNGIFFTFTPSKNSTSWVKETNKFDDSTILNFKRKNSPYYGNKGFFRFISLSEIKKKISNKNLKIQYCETISKTYNNNKEIFQFISLEAKKINR